VTAAVLATPPTAVLTDVTGRSRPGAPRPPSTTSAPYAVRGDFRRSAPPPDERVLASGGHSTTMLLFGRKRVGGRWVVTVGTRSKTLRGTGALARTPSGSGADPSGQSDQQAGADHLRSRPHSLPPEWRATIGQQLALAALLTFGRQHRLNGAHSPWPIRRSGAPLGLVLGLVQA
jgi:hypothetical protein